MPKVTEKFILARKLGMTQVFDKEGNAYAVTLLQAGPAIITQVKTGEKDGYLAVQIGFGTKKHIPKPLLGHLKELAQGDKQGFRWFREWRLPEGAVAGERGAKLDVSMFAKGEKVHVASLSKGKGFQGPVKRHGFGGGPKTHGQKHHHRAPGSIGSTALQRVRKGRRMAGHMGMRRTTVKNLKIIEVLPEENLLALEGSIPGSRGSLVEVFK